MVTSHIQALVELRLLFIYYTESEVNLVGLFKIGLDCHDLRECLLCIIIASVPVIQNANAIP